MREVVGADVDCEAPAFAFGVLYLVSWHLEDLLSQKIIIILHKLFIDRLTLGNKENIQRYNDRLY